MLVSIAVTTSNSERYLKEQIDSLLNQTYKDIEVCVSHDECGDGTTMILDEYVRNDFRVRWMNNPLEKGYVKNTENSIMMCRGEIIFLCDHDDSWDLSRVQKHVNVYLEDPKVQWVCNRVAITDETNTTVIGYIEDTLPDYYREKNMLDNTWGTCIGGAQTSYRRELVQKVMPIGRNAPAHDSWIQLAIWPAKRFFINEILQNYRQHPHNAVGMRTPNSEEFKERERLAVYENLRYLKSLSKEKVLPLWKRSFFLFVYIAKKIRTMVKSIYLQ